MQDSEKLDFKLERQVQCVIRLEAAGYRFTKQCTWTKPSDRHEPTPEECEAVNLLKEAGHSFGLARPGDEPRQSEEEHVIGFFKLMQYLRSVAQLDSAQVSET